MHMGDKEGAELCCVYDAAARDNIFVSCVRWEDSDSNSKENVCQMRKLLG